MTSPLNTLTDTWNSGATTFYGLKYVITDTASAAGSLLLDLQTAALGTRFNVGKTGTTTISNSGGTNFINCLLDGFGSVFRVSGGGDAFLQNAFNTVSGDIHSGGQVVLNSGQNLVWNGLTILVTSVANALDQRNSTSAQTFRVFNTAGGTPGTDYERGALDWVTTSNVLTIGAQAGGTGTLRMTAIVAFQKAGAAVAGDLPSGTFAVVRDTSGATTKLVYNNAGTLMTVALT